MSLNIVTSTNRYHIRRSHAILLNNKAALAATYTIQIPLNKVSI